MEAKGRAGRSGRAEGCGPQLQAARSVRHSPAGSGRPKAAPLTSRQVCFLTTLGKYCSTVHKARTPSGSVGGFVLRNSRGT